jgi:subtilisin family serine protease
VPDEVGGDGAEPSRIRHHTLVDTPGMYHEVGWSLSFKQRINFRRARQGDDRVVAVPVPLLEKPGIDMNLDSAPLGEAFRGDYPESYEEPTGELQRILRNQVAQLGAAMPAGRPPAAIVERLRARREGHPDLAQFELLPRGGGFPAVVARGEVVMTAEAYGASDVRQLLQSRGFERRRGVRKERVGALVRLRHPSLSMAQVRREVEELRGRKITVWPNCMATLAAVGKGIGGPEPVDGPGSSSAPGSASSGPQVQVAVIDTGIPQETRGDGWLNAVPRTDDNIDLLRVLPSPADPYLDFQSGHGTFVAGIVQRVAPGATIRVYRAADTDGFATDDDIADAMTQAADDGAHIINLSLGGRAPDDEEPRAVADAVKAIRQRSGTQVVIVAAAGNYGDEVPCWPAAIDGVEAVAGLRADLSPAQWSSRGTWVRFSAVAEGIRSTFVTGSESPDFDPEPEVFPPDAWALWTGTSFAAPQIAGAVARICQETGLDPREAVDELDRRGLPVDGFGKAMHVLEGIFDQG